MGLRRRGRQHTNVETVETWWKRNDGFHTLPTYGSHPLTHTARRPGSQHVIALPQARGPASQPPSGLDVSDPAANGTKDPVVQEDDTRTLIATPSWAGRVGGREREAHVKVVLTVSRLMSSSARRPPPRMVDEARGEVASR